MPNIHAAAKRMRADRKRRFKNLAVRSELKTIHRRFLEALQKGEAAAGQILRLLVKKLDQAAQKKVIPRNTASRKKSRLARQLAKRIKS
jgi:small subunit ribosomal protein S20